MCGNGTVYGSRTMLLFGLLLCDFFLSSIAILLIVIMLATSSHGELSTLEIVLTAISMISVVSTTVAVYLGVRERWVDADISDGV